MSSAPQSPNGRCARNALPTRRGISILLEGTPPLVEAERCPTAQAKFQADAAPWLPEQEMLAGPKFMMPERAEAPSNRDGACLGGADRNRTDE